MDCTQHFYATNGVFDSPGYPSAYPSGYSDCVAHVRAPPGATVTLQILKFDVESSANCSLDRVEVSDNS